MIKTYVSLILGVFTFSLSVSAYTTDCTGEQVIGSGIVASRYHTAEYGCLLHITPRAKPDMLYREFWIDNRGRFMVFVSVPGEDMSKFTGTRSYYLFPRLHVSSFQLLGNGDLALKTHTDHEVVFNSNARLKNFPGQVLEDSVINLQNNGGFEIQSFQGIRLDFGWKVGTEAYKDPAAKAKFYDAHNVSCEIRNDEFFFYENMLYTEPNLRFPDDAGLAKFLKARCPALDVSPLDSISI